MEQTVKIVFIVLASLLLHLAVLQLRFDSGHVLSSKDTATEVGLVQFSSHQKSFGNSFSPDKVTFPLDSISPSTSSISAGTQSNIQEKSEQLSELPSRPAMAEVEPSGVFVKQDKLLVTPKKMQMFEDSKRKRPVNDSDETLAEVKQIARISEDVANAEQVVEQVSSAKEPDFPDETMTEVALVNFPKGDESEDFRKIDFAGSEKEKSSSGNKGITDSQKAIPRYEINPHPVYPDIALRKGWEGITLLKVDVKDDGHVERVIVKGSSGFRALDRAALKAVRRWQFVPAMSSGVSVDGTVIVPINFDLQ